MASAMNVTNTMTYTAKKPATASTTESGSGCPSSFIRLIACGWMSRWMWIPTCLNNTMKRMILMPPVLEPAQPPMKPKKIRITGSARGHSEKSAIM